ncbi:MAG: hypothetical protein ACKOE6_13920 [Flammeovirgaceae bacterium]
MVLLKVLDLFRPLFEWQKVDFVQLRAIVGVKLMMDNRRSSPFQRNEANVASYSFLWTLILYTIFGGLFSFLIAIAPSIILPYSLYHAYLILMVTVTLISDFSSVLLDTSDNTILLPRPISAKTFYAARNTHILLYVGQLAVALALIPIIVSFVVHGPMVGIATLVTSALATLFSVSLTHGLYLLMLRHFSEEKLKSMINYFQIGMTIFMMGAYQILPRLLGFEKLRNAASQLDWWFLFVPPMWMAGAVDFFASYDVSWMSLTSIVLSVLIPVLSWKAINRYLSPYFSTKLADLGTSSAPVVSAIDSKAGISARLAPVFTKPGLERASFMFAWWALSRDRKLKLRIYPNLGTPLILILIFLLQSSSKHESLAQSFYSLAETKSHLLIIYLGVLALIGIAVEINFSDDHKSSWVFQSTPITKPGLILNGTFKAIMAKFFLPIYLLVATAVLSIWREKAIADLILGALASWLLVLTSSVIADKHMPLSLALTDRNRSSSMVRVIITMILVALMAGGHYLISSFTWAVYAAIFITAVTSFFLHRLYENATWDDIT